MTTTPVTPASDEVPLAKLIPTYQAMQAVLAYPPSAELTRLVEETLSRTTDPMMRGFLNLLITGQQEHRDLAAQIFHQLEVKLAAARQAELAKAAKQAEALVVTLPEEEIPDAAPLSVAPSRAAVETTEIEPAPSAIDLAVVAANEPAYVPWCIEGGEHYQIEYSKEDKVVTHTERFSIITANTEFADRPDLILKHIRAVIIGVKGQSSIENGFGFVLPLSGVTLQGPDATAHIPLRLEYPTAIPQYDHDHAAGVAGLKEFLAIHEVLRRGYTFCLDLYVKVNANPNNGHSLSLTVRQEKLLLRRQMHEAGYGSDGAMFSSTDLADLNLAAGKMALVGILADHEGDLA